MKRICSNARKRNKKFAERRERRTMRKKVRVGEPSGVRATAAEHAGGTSHGLDQPR